jgi:hypothetical protein
MSSDEVSVSADSLHPLGGGRPPEVADDDVEVVQLPVARILFGGIFGIAAVILLGIAAFELGRVFGLIYVGLVCAGLAGQLLTIKSDEGEDT